MARYELVWLLVLIFSNSHNDSQDIDSAALVCILSGEKELYPNATWNGNSAVYCIPCFGWIWNGQKEGTRKITWKALTVLISLSLRAQ